MLVQHQQRDSKGVFFIEEEGNMLAEIVYTMPASNKVLIEHTEVDEDLQGQSIGFELVQHVVEFARTHGYKVIPVCSFARSVFDKKPDFQDVLE